MTPPKENDKSSNDDLAQPKEKDSPSSNDLLSGFNFSLDDLLDQGISSLTPPPPTLDPSLPGATPVADAPAPKEPPPTKSEEQAPAATKPVEPQEPKATPQEPPQPEPSVPSQPPPTPLTAEPIEPPKPLPATQAPRTTPPPPPQVAPRAPASQSPVGMRTIALSQDDILLEPPSEAELKVKPASPLMSTIHLGPDDILAQESGDDLPVPQELQGSAPNHPSTPTSEYEASASTTSYVEEAPSQEIKASSQETPPPPPSRETEPSPDVEAPSTPAATPEASGEVEAPSKPGTLPLTSAVEAETSQPPQPQTLPSTKGVEEEESQPQTSVEEPEPKAPLEEPLVPSITTDPSISVGNVGDSTPPEEQPAPSAATNPEVSVEETGTKTPPEEQPAVPAVEMPALDFLDPSKATQQVKLSDVEVFVARGRGSSEELPVVSPGSTQSIQKSAIHTKVVRGRGSSAELPVVSPAMTQPVRRADIEEAAKSHAAANETTLQKAQPPQADTTLQKAVPPQAETTLQKADPPTDDTHHKAKPPAIDAAASTLQVRQEDIEAAILRNAGVPQQTTPHPASTSSSAAPLTPPSGRQQPSPTSTLQLPRDEVIAIAKAREEGRLPANHMPDPLQVAQAAEASGVGPAPSAPSNQRKPDLFATRMDPMPHPGLDQHDDVEGPVRETAPLGSPSPHVSLFRKGPEPTGAFMATAHDADPIGTEALDLFEVGDSWKEPPASSSSLDAARSQESNGKGSQALFPPLDPSEEVPLDHLVGMSQSVPVIPKSSAIASPESKAMTQPKVASASPVVAAPKEVREVQNHTRSAHLPKQEPAEPSTKVKQSLDRPLRTKTKTQNKSTNLIVFVVGILLMMSLLTVAAVWFFVFR